MPGDIKKRESISKKFNEALYTGLERITYKFLFFSMENTLNGEKSIEIKHISVN
jgi:hypothetical protein